MNTLARVWTTTVMVLAALLAAGAPCRADFSGDPQNSTGISPADVRVTPGPSSYATGTVVNSSSDQLVVRTTGGGTMEFALDQHRGYGAAMIPGDRVRVEYAPINDQHLVAKNVETLGLLSVLDQQSAGSPVARTSTGSSGEEFAEGNNEAAGGTPGAEASDQLPATASPLPLVLVAGTLLFAAGLGVRLMDRG